MSNVDELLTPTNRLKPYNIRRRHNLWLANWCRRSPSSNW